MSKEEKTYRKGRFAVRQVICSDCGQYESDCKCPVVSPPPVAEDLGERILEQAEKLIKAYQSRVSGKTTDEEFKEAVLAFPDSILALLKEAGWVLLSKDQTLPSIPFKISLEYIIAAGTQVAMRGYGWRKIV